MLILTFALGLVVGMLLGLVGSVLLFHALADDSATDAAWEDSVVSWGDDE